MKLPSIVGSIWVENLLSDPAYLVWFVIVLMLIYAAVRSTAADNVISNMNNTRKILQGNSHRIEPRNGADVALQEHLRINSILP